MRRRQFIALLGGAATWPFTAGAQHAEGTRRIGVLMARKIDDQEGQKQFAALLQRLAELGWIAGQTINVDARWTVGSPTDALKLAHELIGSKPDVLVANATPSLIAIRETATTTPVVFVSVADPVGQGFVPSLARPGGNITGFSVEEASMGGKWIEVLKQTAPLVTRIVTIYNPNTAPYAPMFFPAMQSAASGMSTALTMSPVHSAVDIKEVIEALGHTPGGGLVVLPDSFLFGQRQNIIAFAGERRLPAIYPLRIFVPAGGLIAYGIDRVDLFRRAAAYVDRILHGTSPAELPVQQPTKFELAVNLKTAKELGLSVPQSLLVSADEVIE